MPDQIKYAHHELDPVLMNGHEALIFINGHWQGMCHALAFEAKVMSKDDFYRVFGMVADRVPPTAWQTTKDLSECRLSAVTDSVRTFS